MLLQSFLLDTTALVLGTMAQSTSVMDLFLGTEDNYYNNLTFLGSVISARAHVTTYSVTLLSDGKCSWVRVLGPKSDVASLNLDRTGAKRT